MDLDLNYNGLLGSQYATEFSNRIRILWDRIRSHVRDIIAQYDVRPGNPGDRAESLSGGNKQKFIVGRELERDPSLLLASHPTRGVDIGSIQFIQDRLIEFQEQGRGVLLMTSKLDAAMQLSDRLAVMYDGSFIDVVDPDERTEEEIGLLMAGESLDDTTASPPPTNQ
jgi:simple sugar transport system ATP-binding protein